MIETPLAVVLVTYERTECAIRTILGVREHLKQRDRAWYIADDGSRPEHVIDIHRALGAEDIIGAHSMRMGVGASMNLAWEHAHDYSPLVLWLEDDWELHAPLDIEPYARVLLLNPDICMVRLGHLPINLDCETVGYEGRHYLRIKKTRQYAFSGYPSLRHRRMLDVYGHYKEGLTPGDTEVDYDGRYRAREGPDNLWPVDLGGWGIFGHIGAVKAETLAHA